MTTQSQPTRKLSDGRTIRLSPYGWTILEGDGQAGSPAVREEAWAIHDAWMRETHGRPLVPATLTFVLRG